MVLVHHKHKQLVSVLTTVLYTKMLPMLNTNPGLVALNRSVRMRRAGAGAKRAKTNSCKYKIGVNKHLKLVAASGK